MIERTATSQLETVFGVFDIHVFRDDQGLEHVALVSGDLREQPLVRIHSKCATGDIFGSVYCDCRDQLHSALDKISKSGGVVVYLEQEGRGMGLTHKIKAYELQRQGMDTVEADQVLGEGIDDRSYELAADILKDLEVQKLKLMTNNPDKVKSMVDLGFEVERVQHVVEARSERGRHYQEAKEEKLGHLF